MTVPAPSNGYFLKRSWDANSFTGPTTIENCVLDQCNLIDLRYPIYLKNAKLINTIYTGVSTDSLTEGCLFAGQGTQWMTQWSQRVILRNSKFDGCSRGPVIQTRLDAGTGKPTSVTGLQISGITLYNITPSATGAGEWILFEAGPGAGKSDAVIDGVTVINSFGRFTVSACPISILTARNITAQSDGIFTTDDAPIDSLVLENIYHLNGRMHLGKLTSHSQISDLIWDTPTVKSPTPQPLWSTFYAVPGVHQMRNVLLKNRDPKKLIWGSGFTTDATVKEIP